MSGEESQTAYTYDGLGRLTSEAADGEDTISYTYDDGNNRSTMTAGNTVTTYEYDANNRLITDTKETEEISEITRYGYDHNGNQTYKATEVIKPAEDGEAESIKISVVGENEENSPAIMFNEYDGFNRLVKVLTGSTTAVYGYNGDGLRTSKTVNGVSTKHIWDGSQIALELDDSGNVQSKYVRGINLIYGEIVGAKSYYLFNGHGDVVLLTNTDGDVVKNYDYDAFGNEKNPNPTDLNVFRYCGEYFDKETGTIYLRARYYDPSIGRFISEDSYLGNNTDPLSLNLYTYCNNNPIIYHDPTGRSREAVVWWQQFEPMVMFDGQLPVADLLYLLGYGLAAAYDYGPIVLHSVETGVVDAYYWAKNDAIPWAKNAAKDAGDAIKSGWDNLIQQFGGGSGSPDPNNWNHRDYYLKQAHNKAFRNAINDLYRKTASVGDGGTADMLRYEFNNGQPLKHLQKAEGFITNINKILTEQVLTEAERKLAYQLLNDLYDAVKYVKK